MSLPDIMVVHNLLLLLLLLHTLFIHLLLKNVCLLCEQCCMLSMIWYQWYIYINGQLHVKQQPHNCSNCYKSVHMAGPRVWLFFIDSKRAWRLHYVKDPNKCSIICPIPFSYTSKADKRNANGGFNWSTYYVCTLYGTSKSMCFVINITSLHWLK